MHSYNESAVITGTPSKNETAVQEFFLTLFQAMGHQHWWPSETPFEIVVGAFLTQNTAWTNVELALGQLRQAGVVDIQHIREVPLERLEVLIRSAGFFRQKAQRLKSFVAHVDERYSGSLEAMFARPTSHLRHELLSLSGIGPETADSILLYAGQHEVFVVDAYTRRILLRHQLIDEGATYEDIRRQCERALSDPKFIEKVQSMDLADARYDATKPKPAGAHHEPSAMSQAGRSPVAQIYNEMHALIVGIAKNYCLSRRVLCEECPLGIFLDHPVHLGNTGSTKKRASKKA
jgi:endonuclease III related protein